MRKNREIEVKLRVDDIKDAVSRLKGMRARRIRRIYEENALFDTEDGDLRKREAILRLRSETRTGLRGRQGRFVRRVAKERSGVLTFKGLVGGKRPGGRYKEREEIEYRIGDLGRFARLLRRIGMREWFRYEKYRTGYRWGRHPGLKIDLDETPAGVFLELEGPKSVIDRAAKALGYARREYIAASYFELYAAECARRGAKVRNMMFPVKKNCEK